MEPVKGGSLAGMNNEIQGIMKAQNPDLSIPSWAVRFCAGLDNILTVLSGMSTKAQLDDNVSYMEHFEPLSDKEHEVLKTVVEKLNAIPTIPCTGCRYCVDDCPMQIHIPDIFRAVTTRSSSAPRIMSIAAATNLQHAKAARQANVSIAVPAKRTARSTSTSSKSSKMPQSGLKAE